MNRTLTPDESELAKALLEETRAKVDALAGDDADLRFAYNRKLWKELMHDERSKPAARKKLKALKRKEQGGLCPVCGEPLPEKYTVIDRYDAAKGYTQANTRLLCTPCDSRIQQERHYA
jgi:DNA repair exonuclease SbcCD ATPase subunit